jgi:hypothetical protein
MNRMAAIYVTAAEAVTHVPHGLCAVADLYLPTTLEALGASWPAIVE